MSGQPEINYDHVRDDDVREKFEKVQELQEKLRVLRQEIKEKRGEKDEARKKEEPKFEKAMQKLKDEEEQLRSERAMISQQATAMANRREREGMGRRQLMDKHRYFTVRRGPLEQAARDLVTAYQVQTEKVRRTTAELANMTKKNLAYKSTKDIEHHIALNEQKMKKAKEKGHDSVIKMLEKERTQMEGAVERVSQLEDLKKSLEEAQKKATELEKQSRAKAEELAALTKEADEISTKLDSQKRDEPAEKEQRGELDKLFAKRKEWDEKISKVITQQSDMRKENSGEVGKLDESLRLKQTERDELDKQMNGLLEQIPTEKVSVDPTYMYELIGPEKATQRQIQADFGVVIDIRRAEGEVVIRGTESADCAATITQMLKEAEENRHEETIMIDPECEGEFIGSQGSNIQLMEANSGTKIEVGRSGEPGLVKVIGNKENVAVAMQLIEDFKLNTSRDEVKYTKALDDMLRPHLMKKWQEDYTCRMIRKEPAKGRISIMGKADCVKKAVAEITEFLEATEKLHIPSGVPTYAIIGTKGKTIRDIEAASNCFLNVSETEVMIAGSKESVAKAKVLLATLFQEKKVVELKVPYKPSMHNYLIRRRGPSKKAEEEKPAEEGKEEEKEEHVDPNKEDGGKKGGRKPNLDEVCLLEKLRLEHNCDKVNANLAKKEILIMGPVKGVSACKEELLKLLDWSGMTKIVMKVKPAIVRFLTVNIAPKGEKGVKMRLDKAKRIEGVEEISADFRGASEKVEIIGTAEAAEEARAAVQKMIDYLENGWMTEFVIPQNKVGWLLGRGGETLSGLENEYGVMIHVPRGDKPPAKDGKPEERSSYDNKSCIVTIIGQSKAAREDCCDAALEEIKEDYVAVEAVASAHSEVPAEE